MRTKIKWTYPLLIVFIAIMSIWSCHEKEVLDLKVKALPIDAQIIGDILEGPAVLNDKNRFVWGGSVLKGDDGKYHMVYNTWETGDSIPAFTDSWVLHSKLAYAVSDFPDKNFQFKKIILQGRIFEGDSSAWDAQMVTNPHLKKFNGKYYLYYVGSYDPGLQPPGSAGEKVNKRNRVQQSQKIGVIEFESFQDLLSGNFIRKDKPLLAPRTRIKENQIVNPSPEGTEIKPDNIIVVNPSVVQRPSDGKFLMYFKGNVYDPHWKGVHGLALSDSPDGPFIPTDKYVFDIKLENGKFASAEDPFVWYHRKTKKFYAVIKDFSGKITEAEPGLAILESMDGVAWSKPANSFFMKKELTLKSGRAVKVKRLERPQILLDENDDPMVLYAACSIVDINKRRDGVSFNVQIPLRAELIHIEKE